MIIGAKAKVASDLHLHDEHLRRPHAILPPALLEELKGQVYVMDQDYSLPTGCYGANGPIEVLVLEPVSPFQLAWRREVVDVADDGQTFGTREHTALVLCSGLVCLCNLDL